MKMPSGPVDAVVPAVEPARYWMAAGPRLPDDDRVVARRARRAWISVVWPIYILAETGL